MAEKTHKPAPSAGFGLLMRSSGNDQQAVDDIVAAGGSTLPESQVVMDGFYDE